MARHATWPTPRAVDGSKGGSPTNDDLPNAVRFPTPAAVSYGTQKSRNVNAEYRPSLETMARKALWPTPMAHEPGDRPSQRNRHTPTLEPAVSIVEQRNVFGQLNPTWVEWLMGFPLGWTALEPLATASYPQWQREHG